MDEILYAKISNERDARFQTVTTVLRRNGARYIKKRSLTFAAKDHVCGIVHKGQILRSTYANIENVTVCDVKTDGDGVLFEYVEGRRFDSIFADASRNGEAKQIIETLNCYWDWVKGMQNLDAFYMTPEFLEVFGDVAIDPMAVAGTNVNVDMIFSNLICNEKCNIIDYEWVFPFPVPLEYVLFKALFTSVEFSCLTEEIKHAVYQHFGLDENKCEQYMRMEKNFQSYVKGDKISFEKLAKSFHPKCIDLKRIDWDRQWYWIKCFGRKGEDAVEIFGTSVQPGKVVLNFPVEDDYEKIEIFGAPIGSVISMIKVCGYRGHQKYDVDFRTTADYEEDGAGYYGENTPVFIVQNERYDRIECAYDIQVWNTVTVEKTVRYRRELSRVQKELEKSQTQLTQKQGELIQCVELVDSTRAELLAVGDQKGALEAELRAVGDQKGALEAELRAVGDQKGALEAELLTVGDQRNALEIELKKIREEKDFLENELLSIKNSRTWKIMGTLRGWK